MPTLPTNPHYIGDSGHTSDHNTIVTALSGAVYASGQTGSVALGGATVSGLGLDHIKTQTVSSQATMNVDSVFTSTYTSYLLTFNMTSGTAGQYSRLQLRTGGSSTAGTGYDSYANWYTTATTGVDRASATSSWYNLFTSGPAAGQIWIHNPQAALQTIWNGTFSEWRSGTGYVSGTSAGSHSATTQFDGISWFVGSGTFSGTMRVYGLHN